MFTGIVETSGEVVATQKEGTNIHFTIESSLAPELKIDQSVSHDGVCLTVTAVSGNQYNVTAVDETLRKTTLGGLNPGSKVNLERCMPANGRFDGHIVQGHVDQTAVCTSIADQDGSWLFRFSYDGNENVTVEKGSICVNGVSLTVVNSEEGAFQVAIIPYTFEHTNFHSLVVGQRVNLEFDVVGKYIQKLLRRQQGPFVG